MAMHQILMLAILIITIVNLFYKPHWKRHARTRLSAGLGGGGFGHGMQSSLCDRRGLRCTDPLCDCDVACAQSPGKFEKMIVSADEHVVLHDVRLVPGTYCVPQGGAQCNRRSSQAIYSLTGWLCRQKPEWRGDHLSACKSSRAADNDANVLVDRLANGQPAAAAAVADIYETFRDPATGKEALRYACECNSLGVQGNRMIGVIPFVCSQDYCVRDLTNVPFIGWKDGACECGPYIHRDPRDKASPCVITRNEVEGGVSFTGRVDCMTRESFVRKPVHCPEDKLYLTFHKNVFSSSEPLDYVMAHKDKHAVVFAKKKDDDERKIIEELQQ